MFGENLKACLGNCLNIRRNVPPYSARTFPSPRRLQLIADHDGSNASKVPLVYGSSQSGVMSCRRVEGNQERGLERSTQWVRLKAAGTL